MQICGYEIVQVSYELRYPTQFRIIDELGKIAQDFQNRYRGKYRSGMVSVEGINTVLFNNPEDNFQIRITPNNVIIVQEKVVNFKLIQDEINTLTTQISRMIKIDKFERAGLRLLLKKEEINTQLVSKTIFNELLNSEKWGNLGKDCKSKQLLLSFSSNATSHMISIHILEPKIVCFDIDYGIHSPEKPFDAIIRNATKYIEDNLFSILNLF